MNCPSKNCNTILKEDSNYCGVCGLDLSLDKEEIKARDEMLEMFNEFLTKHGHEPMRMLDLDSVFKYHGARFSMMFMKKSLDAIEKIAKEKQQPQLKPKGLYGLFWKRLLELDKNKEGLVNTSDAYRNLCRSFSIKKRECQELLLMLRDFGLIEFKKRGIKVVM